MRTRNDLKTQIQSLRSLHEMIVTFEEIAAIRIMRTRNSVLKSRDFLFELNTIFQEVKTSRKKEVERLLAKKKVKDEKKFSFIKHNGKTLFILISANTGLYGDIVKRTFDLFRENAKSEYADIAIIGKMGNSYFEKEQKSGFKYFDFPDNGIDNDKLKEIILYLLQYEKVVVFYGKFENIVRQTPFMSDISGNPLPQEEKTAEKKSYLFEPTLENILEFFEKEMFSSIFEQTIKESQLAKYASRMVTLESATGNIKKRIRDTVLEESFVRHRDNNKRQLQNLSSMKLWR